MEVVILAAGFGSRLEEITKETPKALVKVVGKSILEHQIDAYKLAGISEEKITVVVGYEGNQIIDFCNDKYPSLNIINNTDYNKTNNMYSLYLYLAISNASGLMISNGDCVYDPKIIQKMVDSSSPSIIACDIGSYSEESMKIVADGKWVTQISKQISERDALGNSIDLYKFSGEDLNQFKQIVSNELEENINNWTEVAIDRFCTEGKIAFLDIENLNWVEIDNQEDLLLAEKRFSGFSLGSKRAMVLDLDGTVYLGKNPIVPSIDFINTHQECDLFFLTNNSSCSPSDYHKKLLKMGISREDFKVLTPLFAVAEYIKSKKLSSIYFLGTESAKAFLEECCNIRFKNEYSTDIEALLVGYDTELTYNKLKIASNILNNLDVEFLATHLDLVCPTESGDIPDSGLMVKMLEDTSGKKVDKVFGKPYKTMIEDLLKSYKAEDLVLVGDRLYTDKVLADTLNIDFVLVLSGESKLAELQPLETSPALVLENLGGLKEFTV